MIAVDDERLPVGIRRLLVPEPNSGCWLWVGYVMPNGYGTCRKDRKGWLVHRLAYTLLVAEIPEGLQLDHLCRTRCCANPAHLEPVTHQQNVRRSPLIMAGHRASHCPRGHEYVEANTYMFKGRRRCRTCRNRHWREWYARRRDRV